MAALSRRDRDYASKARLCWAAPQRVALRSLIDRTQ
jgi:hypothetical protein